MQSRQMKGTKRDEPGATESRGIIKRAWNEMYERIQVVRALPELSGSERTDGDGAAGSRLFKSRFFRPRCHSQAPADIPIDVQQGHLRENRPCSP